ncbi:hypothetical protein [Nonomuraea sp. NPDC049400]|uniref:hypothetical protein n=1 Tax=Nonomuraea sp. NPDC049400 TaxID=3364352 RepID=UPI00379EDA11
MSNFSVVMKGLSFAILIVAAVIFGIVGGGLAWWGGMKVPLAIAAGAAAFGAFVTLGLQVLDFFMPS